MAAATPPSTSPRGAALSVPQKGWRRWLPALVLLVGGSLAYINSFGGAFVFDDRHFILENPQVHHFAWRDLLQGGGLRKLAVATFAANYQAGGFHPAGYHAVNLAIHLTAGLLLFGLLRRLLLLAPQDWLRAQATNLSLAISLLWLVHPLQTESVTYIVQRCESLMGMCYFLCLYSVARGATSTRHWPWYLLSVVAIPLGLGAKESMVTAPVAVLLMDRLLLSRSWRQLWHERKWLYVVYLLPVAFAAPILLMNLVGSGESTVGFGVEKVTSLEYLRTQPGVVSYYLWLSIAPISQCFDYDWQVAQSWYAVVIPAGLLAGMLVVGLLAYRRQPLVAFAVLFFFLHLAPTSSFVPIRDIAVEHRMYVPLAAVLSALVIGGFWLLRRLSAEHARVPGIAAASVIGLIFMLLTVQRNQLYQQPIDLWRDVVAKAPHNARAYNNLADALVAQRRFDEALAALEASLELTPDSATTHTGIANVLAEQDQLDLAARHAAAAVKLKPDWAAAHLNLAFVLSKQQRYPEAAAAYRAALKINHGSAIAHANLSRVLLRLGKLDDASQHLAEAQAIDPRLPGLKGLEQQLIAERRPATVDDVTSLKQRALALLQKRQAKQAQHLLTRALALDQANAETHFLLATAFDADGDLDAAAKHYAQAIELEPGLARAHNNLGSIVSAQDPARAIKHFQAALETDPNYVEALGNLGNALARTRQFSDAVACYRRALEIRPDFVPAKRNLQQVEKLLREQAAQR